MGFQHTHINFFSLAHVFTYAHFSTLLLAGFETTATSLSWSILEIARHTTVQNKLRQEIRAKEREIKARGDSEFTSNDFDAMPYLTAVLKVSSLWLFWMERRAWPILTHHAAGIPSLPPSRV